MPDEYSWLSREPNDELSENCVQVRFNNGIIGWNDVPCTHASSNTLCKPEHTVTIFTDVDCGYCRKLHREMASYNDLGIRVRYLMFPRAGVNSESFNTAVSVWCADDQQTAMTRAKLGKSIEAKTCANPIAEQYSLGQQLGVRGTPSIILDNGEMVPGYVPAARLVQMFK